VGKSALSLPRGGKAFPKLHEIFLSNLLLQGRELDHLSANVQEALFNGRIRYSPVFIERFC